MASNSRQRNQIGKALVEYQQGLIDVITMLVKELGKHGTDANVGRAECRSPMRYDLA